MAPTAKSTRITAGRTRGIDDEVETLAIELTVTTDVVRRGDLIERICLLALPLADTIALRYRGRGIDTEDLQQVARTALVKAIHRYRPGAGPGFTAYATPTISGEVKRWFRDHGWAVRPPRRLQELRAQVIDHEESLRHRLGRPPDMNEIAEEMHVSRSDVGEAKACSANYHATSLDAPTSSGMGEDLLATSAPYDLVDSLDALHRAFARLTDRQRRVLHLRYVDERTQSEIAELIGVSQMQISRILRTTLEELRRELYRAGVESATPAA